MTTEKNFHFKVIASFGTMMATAALLVLTTAVFTSLVFADQALQFRNMQAETTLHTAVAVSFAFATVGAVLIYMSGSFMKK